MKKKDWITVFMLGLQIYLWVLIRKRLIEIQEVNRQKAAEALAAAKIAQQKAEQAAVQAAAKAATDFQSNDSDDKWEQWLDEEDWDSSDWEEEEEDDFDPPPDPD